MPPKKNNQKIRVPGINNSLAKKFVSMAKTIQAGVDNIEKKGISAEEYIIYSTEMISIDKELIKLEQKLHKMFYKLDNHV